MHWDGYTICSVLSGVVLVVLACVPGRTAKERAWLTLAGVAVGGYGIYVAKQTSGIYYFSVWIFVIPVVGVGYLLAPLFAKTSRQSAPPAPRAGPLPAIAPVRCCVTEGCAQEGALTTAGSCPECGTATLYVPADPLDTSARTRSCITDDCQAEDIPTNRPVCEACGVATVEMLTTAAASPEKDATPTASPHPPGFRVGVTPSPVNRSGQLGLEIASVSDGSPAQQAGLRAGDLIVAVGSRPVASSAAFDRLLPTVATGGAVAVEWLRHGRTHHAEVLLPASPTRTTLSAVAATPEPAAPPVRPVRSAASIPAARLGLTPRPVPRSGQLGLEVASVSDGSPAQQAGLRAGDLIVAVGSRPVASSAAFDRLLPTVAAGGAVAVEWLRDGRTHHAEVALT
jgi:membrane-associated protease RseP (regulator of RpoE activity)